MRVPDVVSRSWLSSPKSFLERVPERIRNHLADTCLSVLSDPPPWSLTPPMAVDLPPRSDALLIRELEEWAASTLVMGVMSS